MMEAVPVAEARSLALRSISIEQTEFFEIDPLQDGRWTSFVEGHPRSSVFHSRHWLQALNNAYGYRPLALTTSSSTSHLQNALVFCEVRSWLTGTRLVSLPFSDHCEPLTDASAELGQILSAVKQRVERRQAKYFEIRPRYDLPDCYTQLSASTQYYFHSLDLRPASEEIFRRFHKDCAQRKIRRAEREKLRYEEGSSESLLRDFYELFVMTRRRQYLPPQSIGWFRELASSFGDALKIRVAYKDTKPVASILTLEHKRSMVYKYGCSDAAFNNLGGTQLLFWNTIQDAKSRGFEELDMGRSDVSNAGLIAFKEHWGAVRSSLSYWTYPPRTGDLPGWVKNKLVKNIVSVAPDVALEAVGRLLYPHIG